MHELFFLTKKRNRETTQMCQKLATGVATSLLVELENTSKATFEYLSVAGGQCSQAVMSMSEEMATFGMQANNDPSEGTFATFTNILCNSGRINLSSASAIGQTRHNKDFIRCHEQFVTGRKAQKKTDESCQPGTFHRLPIELQDSLLSMCK